jgi:hypothetical protein
VPNQQLHERQQHVFGAPGGPERSNDTKSAQLSSPSAGKAWSSRLPRMRETAETYITFDPHTLEHNPPQMRQTLST